MLPTFVRAPGLLDEVLADTRTQMTRQTQGKTAPQLNESGLAGVGRRGTRRISNGNRVPKERLLRRTPLHCELIRSRPAGRPPEVEPAESVAAAGPNRLPIQEHVRGVGAVL